MDVTKNGDIINRIITITNGGPDANTNVTVQDNIPAGLAYQSYTIGPPVKGTFNMSNGLWTVGTHNVGLVYKILIKYKVVDISLATAESDTYGFLLSSVISGDNLDPNDVNNTITEFVGITTCAPSAGAVEDLNACFCGCVSTNDTPCSHGITKYKITVGSLVNLDPEWTINEETGCYNATGSILNPYEEASFTYSIWCIVGDNEYETSGPVPVTFPAMFPESFTDSMEDNQDGLPMGITDEWTHTSVDGEVAGFRTGWAGFNVWEPIINANYTFTVDYFSLANFVRVDDSNYADIEITIPDLTTFVPLLNGKTFIWTFKRVNAFDGGSITIMVDGGKTIDGQVSYEFADNDYASITIWTDGTNYWVA